MGSVGARAARRLAWLLCGLSILLAVTGAVLAVGGRASQPDLDYGVAFFAVFLAFTLVGAVVAARHPESAIGWLLLAQGLLWELAGVVAEYADDALFTHAGAGWPGGIIAAWVLSWLWIPTLGMVPFLFALFPESQARSRTARLILSLATVGVVLTLVGRALAPGRMHNTAAISNPYGLSGASGPLSASEAAGTFLLTLTIVASIVSLVVRFRRAGGTERLQLKCLAYAGGLVVVAFSAGNIVEGLGYPALADNIRIPALLALPIAMAVAVLRYRLYEIDVVVSKTVVLGGLVGFVTAVYLVVVVGIAAAVGAGAGSNLASAIVATALVAVAFQPLRERLQLVARRLVFGRPTRAEQQAGVAVHCLGAFRVMREGSLVPLAAWQSRKARTLLKILVARRGRSTTRDFLMEALWPDESPEAVTRRLSVAMATLRAVLDPDKRHPPDHFVIGDRDAVRLDLANLPIDVEQFLAAAAGALASHGQPEAPDARADLAHAESLYTGDFLDEDPYEDWAMPLRDEARTTYVSIVRALASLAEASGHLDDALRYHRRVLERDPWDERAHLALVSVLERSGRHGEARRCYRVYVSRMEDIQVRVAPFPAS